MNQRIEPLADPNLRPAGESPASAGVQTVARAMAGSRVTVVFGVPSNETSNTARDAAIAHAARENKPTGGQKGDIVVVFDEWSGNPLLALIDSIAIAVDHATGTLVTRPSPDPRSLGEVLAHWGKRFDTSFIIVLDRFDRNLAAEPLSAGNARFTEHLAQAIEASTETTRFVVVLDPRNASLLHRLSSRLSRPCTNVVRIESPPPSNRQAGAPFAREPAGRQDVERTAEERLPHGFSAIGDGNIDSAATEAVLRRREQRRRSMRWAIGGGIALTLAIAIGVSLLVVRSRSVDPGALMTRRVEPATPTEPVRPPVDVTPPATEPATAPNAGGTPSRSAHEAGQKPAPSADAATTHDSTGAVPATPKEPVAAATGETTRPPNLGQAPVEKPRDAAPGPEKTDAPRATVAAAAVAAPADAAPAETGDNRPIESHRPKADPRAADKPERKPAAFRIDAPPAPPIPERVVRKIPNPERGPMVFLHIRSESQRAKARELERGLARMGIVVSGIRVDEGGPLRADLRYFRSAERDEANYLRTALGRLGAAPARTSFVPGHEADAARRHYELWFAPPGG